MKIFYDIPYMKGIMKYVLIPVIVIILIVGICLFLYSRKHKDHEDPHYNFVMDFWSSLIGIIVTGAILAIAVGFSIAMTEKMREYGLVEEKKALYYLLKYFIVIPFIFVVWYIVKFLKTIYYKTSRKTMEDTANSAVDLDSSYNTESVQTDNSSLLENVSAEDSRVEVSENVDEEEILPSIEETIEEEMKNFSTEKKASVLEKSEEPEIISLEDDL